MNATDQELLERFLKAGDQATFTELVRRHLGLVHSAALRIINQPALAEEVSQLVFTKLARLRSPLTGDLSLVTWLHRTTRSMAIDMVRAETRRRKREETAVSLAMQQSSIPWEEISPVLDEVIDKLGPDERHMVLSRYFEGQTHAELARSLGVSEDAVRMRVNRALEKIRALLQKRGITTTASALSAALPAHAIASLPSGLASAVVTTAVASFTPSISIITLGIITMTKKTAITAATLLLIAGASTAVYITSKTETDRPKIATGSEAQASAGSAGVGESRDSSRSRSRERQESKSGSDLDANLVSQYGGSRVILAKRIASSMIGLFGEDGLVGVASIMEEETRKGNLDALDGKLGLSNSQKQQALEIYLKLQATKNQKLKDVVDYLKSNSSTLSEVLLAGDAFKRNKISRQEYDVIAGKMEAKKASLESAMDFESMGSFDDLLVQQEFVDGLKPFLDPAQIQLLEENAAKVPAEPEVKDAPANPVSVNIGEPETLENLDEKMTSVVSMVKGIKAAVEGMKSLQGLQEGMK